MTQHQPKLEKLKFHIGLSGSYWNKRPAFTILVDNEIAITSAITAPSNSVQFFDFELDLEEDTEHTLCIRLENKTDDDVIQNEDKTAIIEDMLLNIISIEIDDIDIGDLKWQLSTFVGDDVTRPVLKNCINLGWNGTYTLPFTSPFYLWLLENN